ncbi:MAG TPA: hypothetical protein VGI39_11745 [Polyangiaceae bacterium]
MQAEVPEPDRGAQTSPSSPSRPPVVSRLAAELRQGVRAALETQFDSPPRDARLHRFLHGFALPFGVLRASLRDPDARRAYLRMFLVQIPVVVAVACLAFPEEETIASVLKRAGWHDELRAALAYGAALLTALSIGEWVVVALGHEFHDAFGATAARLTNAIDEPLEGPPRIRFDPRWLVTKLRRKVRDALLMACGAPIFCFVLAIDDVGDGIFSTLMVGWAGYWASVFALGNTFLAWQPREGGGGVPWFLHGAARVGRVPVIGWVARLYGRIAARVTRSVTAACLTFEEAPYEAAGLALARLVCGVPFLYLAMRPVFGVAATHALVGRRERDQSVSTYRGLAPASSEGPGEV